MPSAPPTAAVAFSSQAEAALIQHFALTNADTFGRRARLRSSLNSSMSERRDRNNSEIAIELEVGRRKIQILYSGDHDLPRWAKPVLESLTSRWGEREGWDGYKARPTDPDLVAVLLNSLQTVMPERGKVPTITPLADGGVQAEWQASNVSLELIVAAYEPPRFYHYNGVLDVDRDGALHEHVEEVSLLIESFSR